MNGHDLWLGASLLLAAAGLTVLLAGGFFGGRE